MYLTKKTNIEKFDFEIYKNSEYGNRVFTKKDGTKITMIDFDKENGGVQSETSPKPNFFTTFKEFYSNGNLKKKEHFLGRFVKIGVSENFDEDGSKNSSVNEDENFGTIKPNDILRFLEKKGFINLQNGDGRENPDGSPKFELNYEKNVQIQSSKNSYKSVWHITITQGRGITPKDLEGVNVIGEPSEWFPFTYDIDGETGNVIMESK